MLLPTLDLTLRAVTAAILLLLAALMLRDVRTMTAGRLAVAFAVGSAAHALSSSVGFAAPVAPWRALLIALATGNVVIFWLFTKALFGDGFIVRWWHAALWALLVGASLVNCLVLLPADAWAARLFSMSLTVATLGFVAMAIGQAIASWSVDLVEDRRQLRVFIVAAAALYAGLNAVLQLTMGGTAAPGFVDVANAALLAGIVTAIAFSLMRVGGDQLFPAVAASAAAGNGEPQAEPASADQALIAALNRLMADDRIYRQEGLSIGVLAMKLGLPEYRLRRLINQRLGYRNFNVFLNNYRIAEAKTALADPSQAAVPVITIAMDAGFQSLGPFNRAFKATTGVTPTEYRRLNIAT
ncbi:MAG: AraC family transcriptional regulator [Rhizobiales bacterium]|nr:AraC family transcriptional regulator [Hyphomicrobiales bacterium]